MRCGSKLRDHRLADKVIVLAAILAIAGEGSAHATLPADPCRGIRINGLPGGLSCPQLGGFTRAFADIVSEAAGRSLPVISAAAGFAYRYDSESDAFERVAAIPGQLYVETPSPLGKGRWNASFSYQHVGFSELGGKPLDDLHDTAPPIRLKVRSSAGPLIVPITIPFLEIDPDINEFTLSATYGVTNALDLNVTMPLVYATLKERYQFTLPQAGVAGCKELPVTGCVQGGSRSTFGIGDVFVRGKYRLLDRDWAEVAGGLVVRLPTGDPDDLTGLGVTQVAPLIYAAGRAQPLGPVLTVRPYLNAGVVFDASNVDDSEGRWALGADLGMMDRVTFGLAVLARYPFARTGAPGAFDAPRCGAFDTAGCKPDGTAPLFGLNNQRVDYYDLSFGLRVNLWRDILIGFANALVPLGSAGLRSDVVPLVGVEAAF